MKRCPECGRDYNDDSLSFCLDDGAELLFGPATNEPATAILPDPVTTGEARTRTFDEQGKGQTFQTTSTTSRPTWIIAIVAGIVVAIVLGVAGYFYYGRSDTQ